MRRIRIALCQLRSHPALEAGRTAFLQEPFLPDAPDAASLAKLAARGLDVLSLQIHCQQRYTEWQKARLGGVLDWVSPLEPDLVLFPEGAVPVDALEVIADWSARTGGTVLAGSHTPLRTQSALRTYSQLGIDKKNVARICSKYRATNVLALIRSGRATLVPKTTRSPYETANLFSPDPAIPKPQPIDVTLNNESVKVLPLICSDALQFEGVRHQYSLAAAIAYDHRPEQFSSFIEQQVRNRHAVVLCNDAQWGGSRFGAVVDSRTADWFHPTFPRGLPAVDSILVVDLDLEVVAVEVSTAKPRQAFRLVRLAEVVYQGTSSLNVSAEVARLRAATDSSAERSTTLREILETLGPGPLQQRKLTSLLETEQRGAPAEDLWDVLGDDCQLQTLTDLTSLESDLAAFCQADLTTRIGAGQASKPDVLVELAAYLVACRRHAMTEALPSRRPSIDARNVIDRDEEVRRILEFLDHPALSVLDVHGLAEIGKSSALRRAFSEAGMKIPRHVRLTETSSLEYLLAAIMQRGDARGDLQSEPLDIVNAAEFRRVVANCSVLLIERADHLLEWSRWRDPASPAVLNALVEVAAEVGTKVIFETRHQLPLELADQAVRTRLLIRGLDGKRSEFGVRVLDAQLRRVGFSGKDVSGALKEEIVERLGGHPKAIELAADAIYEQGLSDLLEELRHRKGFVLNFVSRLVEGMQLNDEQKVLLRILNLARTSLPRGVIPMVVGFPVAEPLRNLVALGAVEPNGPDRIELAAVLRDYFSAELLSSELVENFHKEAASAYEALSSADAPDLASLVEAEYHALLVGLTVRSPTRLIDGAVATVKAFMEQQRYEEAAGILRPLLSRRETRELLRLSAQVEAKCGRFHIALPLAQQVFSQDRRDTLLLAELARTALTQFQDEAIGELVRIARDSGVEDVSLLVVEGRLALRKRDYGTAEKVFKRAVQLTERNPWPYFYLGRTYASLGEVEDAISVLVDGERFCYEVEVRSRKPINAIRTQLGLLYLFEDRIDLAEPIIESVLRDDKGPEAVRAYAALTIKRDGVERASEALKRLSKAKIRSGADRAQFHLLYGLFFLGIGDNASALPEFSKAHAADRSNVFVMMKYARSLFDLAEERFAESDDSYVDYARQCGTLVRKILDFDVDNREGVRIAESLRTRFKIDI